MATSPFWPTDSITFCGASAELGQLMPPSRPRIQRLEPEKPVRDPPMIRVAELIVVTFDHRAVTRGKAARFLCAVVSDRERLT